MGRSSTLAVIEPSYILRAGLKRIFARSSFRIEYETASLAEFWDIVPAGTGLAAILIDLHQQAETLEEDLDRLRSAFPEARIVLMADSDPDKWWERAVSVGADGLLLKTSRGEAIVKSMELVQLGERVFPAEPFIKRRDKGTQQTLPQRSDDRVISNLSMREIEVLKELSDGSANKAIARRLGISEATVKVHVKAILRKTRARNRTEAAVWAKARGLDDATDSPE
jgi:two-component system nitrate/nitrite response regulator NarL